MFERGAYAIDIDDTVALTAQAWASILIEQFGAPDGLSASEIFKVYGIIQNVPHWQTPEARDWIRGAINSTEIYDRVEPISEARDFLSNPPEGITIGCYLTARPDDCHEQTSRWLKRHGFPHAPLLCRPSSVPHNERHPWKARELEKLYPSVIGLIDDQVEIAHELKPSYPGRVIIVNGGDHSPPLPQGKACYRYPNWQMLSVTTYPISR